MNACVIMHNMIIENEYGQEYDYAFYDLMGKHLRVRKKEERVACLLASYHGIRDNNVHDDLQKNIID
jgi:hypothetical protein